MATFLLKTEPSDYSFDDLLRDGTTLWGGVKNALAQQHLARMKQGDAVLVYHTGKEKQVVGEGRVESDPVADPADTTGRRRAVVIRAVKRLSAAVPLAAIKSNARLAALPLLKISRLSVMPITEAERREILRMAGTAAQGGRPRR